MRGKLSHFGGGGKTCGSDFKNFNSILGQSGKRGLPLLLCQPNLQTRFKKAVLPPGGEFVPAGI